MLLPVASSSASPPSNSQRVSICEKVAQLAYVLFQVIIRCTCFRFSELYWDCKHYGHLKKVTSYFAPSPVFKAPQEGLVSELLCAYGQLKKTPNPVKMINRELKRGCCHAEALALVSLMKEKGGVLPDHICALRSSGDQIATLEALEIFRYTFEIHGRDDLVQKMQPLLPPGTVAEKRYENRDDAQSLKKDLQDFKGLVVTRLYTDSQCHTILLSCDPTASVYGFYNPKSLSGYYEYNTLNSFLDALKEHVKCHEGQHMNWHLSFYTT